VAWGSRGSQFDLGFIRIALGGLSGEQMWGSEWKGGKKGRNAAIPPLPAALAPGLPWASLLHCPSAGVFTSTVNWSLNMHFLHKMFSVL
jgi:hypothetical protein